MMLWCRTLLIALFVLLNLGGILFFASLSFDMEQGGMGMLVKQLAALLVGVAAVIILHRTGIDWLQRRWAGALMVLGTVGLLGLTHVIGSEANNATRWIRLGPISIQPAEIAKLTLIITLASYCAWAQNRMKSDSYGMLVPLMLFALYAGMVYFTKDLGSVVVMAGILWLIMFFSGGKVWTLTILGLLAMPVVAWFAVVATSWRYNRIMAFFDPFNRDIEATYHLRQSLISFSNGGTHGVGLGQGAARQGWLPEYHTDFIYAVIGEEFGLIGAAVVAIAYTMVVVLGLVVVGRSRQVFDRLIAAGVVGLIGIQAFWNMMVATGLAPTKGLTLPFISYGGSSLGVCLVGAGLLLVVARRVYLAEQEEAPSTTVMAASVTRRGARVQTGIN